MTVELGVYIPQVGFAWNELRERVVQCDELGIPSVWFMDHLAPPLLPHVPAFEAWTTAAALAELPRKLDALRAECRRIGRNPSTLRVTEEAVLALVARRDQLDDARALAERRFGDPSWGFAAGGYLGTPDDIIARIRARMQLGVAGFIFFFHDRAEPETLRLFAREVVPALHHGTE